MKAILLFLSFSRSKRLLPLACIKKNMTTKSVGRGEHKRVLNTKDAIKECKLQTFPLRQSRSVGSVVVTGIGYSSFLPVFSLFTQVIFPQSVLFWSVVLCCTLILGWSQISFCRKYKYPFFVCFCFCRRRTGRIMLRLSSCFVFFIRSKLLEFMVFIFFNWISCISWNFSRMDVCILRNPICKTQNTTNKCNDNCKGVILEFVWFDMDLWGMTSNLEAKTYKYFLCQGFIFYFYLGKWIQTFCTSLIFNCQKIQKMEIEKKAVWLLPVD